jgi:glycosyltransferase domain-containing protein
MNLRLDTMTGLEINRLGAQALGPPAAAAELTIILPTHNRNELCKAQVRFLQRRGIRHRVIVADSSDDPDEELRKICTDAVEYRRFKPSTPPATKYALAAQLVTTSYLAMITDDDISLPHAIDACLDYLRSHPDYAVAQGYVLDFSISETLVDIRSVRWFTPSIAESTPVRRLYELMRRYQPSFWTVFRTDSFVRAITAAEAAKGAFFFQELTFTATIALLGNSARLPIVQTLRGQEVSTLPAAQGHPFLWFIKDAGSFFAAYVRYRNGLLDLLQELETGQPPTRKTAWSRLMALFREPPDTRLQHDTKSSLQALDIIHACYFGREIDMGRIDHTARVLLGEKLERIERAKPVDPEPPVDASDLTHASAIAGRRYVWRSAVFHGEAAAEVAISREELARVEGQIDEYLPPA